MKENLLIIGAGPNGVTGNLFKEKLKNKFNVLAPSSKELDLTNDSAVDKFFNENEIDYVVHCATFRPLHNTTAHFVDDILESNLRMYFSLARQSYKYKKMIYFGSGAEYNKTNAIVNAREEDIGRTIPIEPYGFGKYIMNEHCRHSENIVNFRLFGTINPLERCTKNVISNMCAKAIIGTDINLKRDCRFSFIDMADVLLLVETALQSNIIRHDYNITDGRTYLLSEIACIVSSISGKNISVKFQYEGLNREYTGSNLRILSVVNERFRFSNIEDSIKRVYDYYNQHRQLIDIENLDSRWK